MLLGARMSVTQVVTLGGGDLRGLWGTGSILVLDLGADFMGVLSLWKFHEAIAHISDKYSMSRTS